MDKSFFIHHPENWSKKDLDEIEDDLSQLGFSSNIDAAIGESAGGHGFDDVIELLLSDPISSGIIATMIWEAAKKLWSIRPKTKKGLPSGIKARYRLVVHTSDGSIISINLSDKIEDIEIALKSLPENIDIKTLHLYQNGKNWEIY